jgi:hypothetical protein
MRPPVRRENFFGTDTRRNGAQEIGLFVPAAVVYPGLESSEQALLQLLAKLSRNDTLFQCARTNTIVTGFGGFDIKERQEIALRILCTPEEVGRINAFAREHPGAGPPIVFFQGQLLELARWAARYCKNLSGDGETFLDPDARTRFVQAALIASTLWSARTYGTRLAPDSDIEAMRERALGSMRKGVEETNLAPHLGVALGRGWLLFSQYLPRRYPEFEADFVRATGLNLLQYFVCLTALSTYTLFNRPEGPLFNAGTVAAATAYGRVLQTFLGLLSQTPDQLATSLWDRFEQTGYRSIRDRPIMVAENGLSIIFDPKFFYEAISVGPLFHVLPGAVKGKDNEIFGAFGLAFEDYATDILKRMYPSRPGLVDRLAFDVPGRDGQGREFQIDAVLNDATEVVVLEMKAAWLREDSILDKTPEKYLNHIRSKYGVTPPTQDQTRERPKGVAQLARIISAIVRREWIGDSNEFAAAQRIYPILVVHDARLDAPAHGNFLQREFTALLGSIPESKVAPLTIMTIQDLENLESSVGQFGLRQLLADYTRECPDRIRSLHNYIAFSNYGKMIAPSVRVMESTKELGDRAHGEFFPTTPDPLKPVR